jgi:4-aminobutyrate aminotransferase-like enzyme/Ser/Thr protein kinase RdoA (MazF antagonist)
MDGPIKGDVLTAAPPRFAPADAEAVAARVFGVEGTASELGSERDQNFHIEAANRSYTLKISNSGEDPSVIEMETAAMLHIARVDPSIVVPEPTPTRDGLLQVEVEGPDGARHLVRLLTYLDGLSVVGCEVPLEGLHGLGAHAAKIGIALRGFFHPAAGRRLEWDSKHLLDMRPILAHIEDPAGRDLIARTLDRFEDRVMPSFAGLRAQVIHGDLAAGNVLIDEESRVTGTVDFGDMTHTALVCDLVTALAWLVRGREEPFPAIERVLTGYSSVATIEPEEEELLSDLLLARLATALLVSTWRVRQYPENADYITEEDADSWHLLRIMDDVGFDTSASRIRTIALGVAGGSGIAERMGDEELLERRRRVLGGSLAELSYERPLHLVRGRGAWMFDPDGRAYLDSYNNVPVVGHSHPRVVEAIARQARLLNTNTRYLHENVVVLAERLTASMPDELDTCLFVNSGSEANDAAWRLATSITGGTGAIITRFAYHGVSTAIIDLSPEEWPDGRQPPHVETIPAPDAYRGEYAETADWRALAREHTERAIAALESRALRPALAMLDTGYMSDGILAPPPAFLQEVHRTVRAAGALLVADEVQAGYGRTGVNLWSYADSDVVPDFVTLGKPMGNGHPVAATITHRDIAERFAKEQEFFSTFGGNPVACAAALAVLDVVEEEDLVRNASEIGAHLQAGLRRLMDEHPVIGDVRGRGLMIGVELVRDRTTKEPAATEADGVVNGMRDRGVLIGSTGPQGNVLKVRPSLSLTREEADRIAEALDETLRALPPR